MLLEDKVLPGVKGGPCIYRITPDPLSAHTRLDSNRKPIIFGAHQNFYIGLIFFILRISSLVSNNHLFDNRHSTPNAANIKRLTSRRQLPTPIKWVPKFLRKVHEIQLSPFSVSTRTLQSTKESKRSNHVSLLLLAKRSAREGDFRFITRGWDNGMMIGMHQAAADFASSVLSTERLLMRNL